MRLRIAMGSGLLGGVLLGAGVAGACGVDGVPSLWVNGRLVALSPALTSSAQLDTWTPFVARGVYPTRRPILFRENTAQVAQSLPSAAFRFPWRWHFGDGTTARGNGVRHTYRRPGAYIVTVEAYVVGGTHHQWFSFDKITIHAR